MIVDSTNPRIMADNIRELSRNGGGGSDLPEVTSADNGKVLGVVEGSWNKMDAPYGVDYSETEQLTGQKWIDGKEIYRKTIDLGVGGVTTPAQSWYTTDYDASSVDKIIDCKVSNDDGAFFGYYGAVKQTNANNKLGIYSTRSAQQIVRYITIDYTKLTETKTTKRKTTKGEN